MFPLDEAIENNEKYDDALLRVLEDDVIIIFLLYRTMIYIIL